METHNHFSLKEANIIFINNLSGIIQWLGSTPVEERTSKEDYSALHLNLSLIIVFFSMLCV